MNADPDTIGASSPGPTDSGHIPVLPAEVVELLDLQPGQVAVDCTAGRGGHAMLLAEQVGASGTVVINDVDPANLAASAARLASLPSPPKVIEIRGNFVDLPRRLADLGLAADAILADLGFASSQMADPARGLSFMRDGPLDMRLDPTGPLTAANLVNTLSEDELAEIIRDYGEDRMSRRIAQKLVAARATRPIETTLRLASVVRSAFGIHDPREDGQIGEQPPGGSRPVFRKRPGERIDPATRTFQALRIAVNDELGALRSLLESITRAAAALVLPSKPPTWLAPGARVAIISFHSLEDRLVKQRFAELCDRGVATPLTKKPVEATDNEAARNPRSRSAKLRVIQLGARNPRRSSI